MAKKPTAPAEKPADPAIAPENYANYPLAKITPYDKNPRDNADAVAAVMESIRQFGFRSPIILDADGVIIAGHTRYQAAKKLKLKQVPVIIARDLTPDQVRAYRIVDNKTGELATWDQKLLAQELTAIIGAEVDIDFALLGFEQDELDGLLGAEVPIDDPPPADPASAGPEDAAKYMITLECADEAEQQRAWKLLTDNDFKPRVSTLH